MTKKIILFFFVLLWLAISIFFVVTHLMDKIDFCKSSLKLFEIFF